LEKRKPMAGTGTKTIVNGGIVRFNGSRRSDHMLSFNYEIKNIVIHFTNSTDHNPFELIKLTSEAVFFRPSFLRML
jgi:hypothetical protein